MNKRFGERKSVMYTANQILKKDGLSLEILYKLSYQSKLGINLKESSLF